MKNHRHFVVWPRTDDEVTAFFRKPLSNVVDQTDQATGDLHTLPSAE